MKILNLYAGIGGNRKLWGDEHEITAVEINEEIASIYQENFPKDKVVIADAHQYLLEQYKEFDFIWSSPPCQSHSVCNHFLKGQGIIRYPDMKLYEEIIFLQTHAKGLYAVENVKSYYAPLIKPQQAGRHYFWANFTIGPYKDSEPEIGTFNRQASKQKQNKAKKNQILRNCVHPKLGLHVFECAFRKKQLILSEQAGED